MIVTLAIIGYLFVGLLAASFRAWRIGVHRKEQHGGREGYHCYHWACELMHKELVFVHFALWPVAVPISVLWGWFELLMAAPHKMSLPPANEAPGRRID